MASGSGYECILTETRGGVGLLTLHRPKALNALSGPLMEEVNDATKKWDEDPDIGAIVITGSEKAFAAGADIKEMAQKTYPATYYENMFASWQDVAALRTPTIAAVNGYALGGGCELAMMCDIMICGERAKFGQPEILLGTIPGAGGTQPITHAAQEAGMIIRGAIELTVDGETQILRKGDGFYFDSRLPHRYRNIGNDPCEIVSALTPPTY